MENFEGPEYLEWRDAGGSFNTLTNALCHIGELGASVTLDAKQVNAIADTLTWYENTTCILVQKLNDLLGEKNETQE